MMLCELEAATDLLCVGPVDDVGIPCDSHFARFGEFGERALSCLSQPCPRPHLARFICSDWVGGDVFRLDRRGLMILDYAIIIGCVDVTMSLALSMRQARDSDWWDEGVVHRLSLAAGHGRVGVMMWLRSQDPLLAGVRSSDPYVCGGTLLHAAMTGAGVYEDESQAQWVHDARSVGMCDLLYVPGTGALDALDNLGRSVVSCAVLSGSSARMDWLIHRREDCDFNVKTIYGCTLLHLAVHSGNIHTLAWLLDNTQIDPTDHDDDGRTALHDAVLHMNVEMCELLVGRPGCEVVLLDGRPIVADRCALLDAVENNDLPMVLWLRSYYTVGGYVDIFQCSRLFTAATQWHRSGSDVLHWLCVNYPQHKKLLAAAAWLPDTDMSETTRLLCCYYDPNSTRGERICVDRRDPMTPTTCTFGSAAIELGTRLDSWRHGATDRLGSFLSVVCVRGIIMDYATCVDQFVPK